MSKKETESPTFEALFYLLRLRLKFPAGWLVYLRSTHHRVLLEWLADDSRREYRIVPWHENPSDSERPEIWTVFIQIRLTNDQGEEETLGTSYGFLAGRVSEHQFLRVLRGLVHGAGSSAALYATTLDGCQFRGLDLAPLSQAQADEEIPEREELEQEGGLRG